jgi:hypothetical protein
MKGGRASSQRPLPAAACRPALLLAGGLATGLVRRPGVPPGLAAPNETRRRDLLAAPTPNATTPARKPAGTAPLPQWGKAAQDPDIPSGRSRETPACGRNPRFGQQKSGRKSDQAPQPGGCADLLCRDLLPLLSRQKMCSGGQGFASRRPLAAVGAVGVQERLALGRELPRLRVARARRVRGVADQAAVVQPREHL